MIGPVSTALLSDVSATVRRHGLVVWMDRFGHYTQFVDQLAREHLAGDAPFPVLAYRGSFLELMLELERYGNGLDRDPLLIHLPGYESTSIRHTPVFEQYEAAHSFVRALDTLVTETAAGRVGPDEIKRFVSSPGITLAQADAWLETRISGARTGVADRLGALDPKQLVDGLLGEDRSLVRDFLPTDLPELAAHLERVVGLDAAWRSFCRVPAANPTSLEPMVAAFSSWLLSVEFVHDLQREPFTAELKPLKRLPRPFLDMTLALARYFRERHPTTYASAADDAETRIEADALGSQASELGKVDTFRFEEARIRDAAVSAARAGRWRAALEWAEQRSGVEFWLEASPPKRWTWTLVQHAATLGVAIEKANQLIAIGATLADAVEAYATKGHVVDLAHRRFEQRHHEIMSGDVEDRDGLLAVIASARRAYRDWADDLARAFTQACVANGFLPDESLQQRTIFDRVVAPLVRDGGKTAVFLVDAFRYEMAAELARELLTPGTGVTVDLKPALAELPTITAVGMNVLAAVNQGQRLDPVLRDGDFTGFQAGEYQVRTPDARARAMGNRADGKTAKQLKLSALGSMTTSKLKETVSRAPGLIVVQSDELDSAGEAGFGTVTFERTLRQLRAAWNLLSQAGVKQFVFLADHGFLLQDETAQERPLGRRADTPRRHSIEEQARSMKGLVCVPLSTLRYQLAEERFLILREDTAVWETTVRGAPFVHGGNSLQERVIPVLVARRKQSSGAADTEYEVRAEALEDRHGRRRVRLQVRLAPNAVGTLAFTGAAYVTLGLRAKDRTDVDLTLTDVEGGAHLDSGTLRVPVRVEWSTVYFVLESKTGGPVQVEVFHPDGREKVEPCTVSGWFGVTAPPRRAEPAGVTPPDEEAGSAAPAAKAESRPPPPEAAPQIAPSQWQDSIDDEGYRSVFLHIDAYSTVTEADLQQLLGSPRRVRAFALHFDDLVKRVPFRVRIETTGVMKTYVKEPR